MKIGAYEVGPGHPTFIVAEGGSNHGGSLDAALALTDAAADAGANAMKWQLWLNADEMYDPYQFPAEWDSARRWCLPDEWLPQLRDRAHERGMAFGLSSFGFASLDEADKWVDFHKVASIESQWPEFVLTALKKSKPTLMSLGMRDLSSVYDMFFREDFNEFGFWKNAWWPDKKHIDLVLMGCTVAYPCDLTDATVASLTPLWNAAISWDLAEGERGLRGGPAIGYSDHTTHPTIAPCAAVALGACVVEKHISLGLDAHKSLIDELTPDFEHSIDPTQFKHMVWSIRATEQALGSSEKRIRPSEEKYLKYRRGPRGLRGA